MAIWVVKFPKGGYKIRLIFGQDSTYVQKGFYCKLWIVMTRQNLDVIVENMYSVGFPDSQSKAGSLHSPTQNWNGPALLPCTYISIVLGAPVGNIDNMYWQCRVPNWQHVLTMPVTFRDPHCTFSQLLSFTNFLFDFQTWNSTITIWVRRGGKFSLTNLHPSSRRFILTSIHC